MSDNPIRPAHYQGSIETFDYMQDKMSAACFEGFLQGNVIKYISRYPMKGGLEDLKKCERYLQKLIEVYEKE